MNRDPKEFFGKRDFLYKVLNCPKDVFIPTTDTDAFYRYPKFSWIYNKKNIYRDFGVRFGTSREVPDSFPVIIKPYMNLNGKSRGLQWIWSQDDLECYVWEKDDIWSEVLYGTHESWDFILINGEIVWEYCFIGYPDDSSPGAFLYWKSCPGTICKYSELLNWIASNFWGYTGCLNVEGKKSEKFFYPLDVHLRMGDLFYLPNRKEVGEAIIDVYSKGIFNGIRPTSRTVYLHPYFSKWHLPVEMVLEMINDEYDILSQFYIDTDHVILADGSRRLFMGTTVL